MSSGAVLMYVYRYLRFGVSCWLVCDVFDVRCLYYILYYTIISYTYIYYYYTYYILYYTLLFFCSIPSFPSLPSPLLIYLLFPISSSSHSSFPTLVHPDLSVNSKYTCRHLDILIYIPQESDPAQTIGGECRVVQF